MPPSVHFLSYVQRKEGGGERESELSGRLKQSHSSSTRASSVCVGDSLAHLNYPSVRNREERNIPSSNQWVLQQPENKECANNKPFESKFESSVKNTVSISGLCWCLLNILKLSLRSTPASKCSTVCCVVFFKPWSCEVSWLWQGMYSWGEEHLVRNLND